MFVHTAGRGQNIPPEQRWHLYTKKRNARGEFLGVPSKSNKNGSSVNCDLNIPNREVRVSAPADPVSLRDEGTRVACLRVLSRISTPTELTAYSANTSPTSQSDPTAYFDENCDWNPTSAAGWFNIHPDLTSRLATWDANTLFSARRNSCDVTEELVPMVGPSTDILGPGDHDKRGDNCLINLCLTCVLQTSAGLYTTEQPSDSVQHWTGSESLPQPTGILGWDAPFINQRSWKHHSSNRPPVVVQHFPFCASKLNAHRP